MPSLPHPISPNLFPSHFSTPFSKRLPALVAILISMTVFYGCGSANNRPFSYERQRFSPGPFDSILESSYVIGKRLAEQLQKSGFPCDRPVMAASFVNINNLEESSTLGRVISEQISSRLAQHCIQMKEIKLRRTSIFVRQGEGEFALSREVRHLSEEQEVYAVLAGTYAISDYTVFLSARVILVQDNTILAGEEYELDRTLVTDDLLR